MSTVIYTTPTCGFCHQAKQYLQQRGAPFVEIDVSQNPQAAMEMVRLSGQQGVPVIAIDGRVVLGFNRPVIDQLLQQRMRVPPKLGVAVADAQQIAVQKGATFPAGAYVGRVNPGSSAAYAGLHVRDVIVRLAGQLVQTDADVHRIMAGLHNNSVAPVTVWRDGRQIDLNVPF
ncbi:MAG: PDZ domain-containing protein [Anaerolineae bacterium]|nr:PDZ domain-containing protein [Anaerolineae bacterium]